MFATLFRDDILSNPREESASLIDERLKTKDRFISIVDEAKSKTAAYKVTLKQAHEFTRDVPISKIIKFKFWKEAKYSLFLSLLLVPSLLYLSSFAFKTEVYENIIESKKLAKDIREILDIPDEGFSEELTDDILDLAEELEDEGIESEEIEKLTKDILDRVQDEINNQDFSEKPKLSKENKEEEKTEEQKKKEEEEKKSEQQKKEEQEKKQEQQKKKKNKSNKSDSADVQNSKSQKDGKGKDNKEQKSKSDKGGKKEQKQQQKQKSRI